MCCIMQIGGISWWLRFLVNSDICTNFFLSSFPYKNLLPFKRYRFIFATIDFDREISVSVDRVYFFKFGEVLHDGAHFRASS